VTRFRVADDVAWVSLEDLDVHGVPTAYVSRLPHGPPTVLEGPACVVWLAIVEGGSRDEVTTTAALMWGVETESIRGDVAAVLEQLLAAGLVSSA
jgi:hypothetical protein